ncbi:prolactin regulatory element-binding protein [Cephus cinctus]|uniref:Prolactin regulatory element-binding protein n=1 Tax=Cephus cinctus TaxID=211228 RepID=A0AAJ7FHQ0_CEPCN|nr:prolactin regulatory element-binding protein [Cephus cinctus]XP_024939417.1 prolactin regulatory element-binding protein [Cephus cinctus]
MPSRRNKGGLLAKVNFPLYTLQMLTSRHVLVGGGGGSSKTGVANGFEIFELSHDGAQFVAEEVTRHETGPSVVMNCTAYNDGKRTWIVAGQESHCQLYNVNTKIITVGNGEILKPAGITSKDEIRQRRKSERSGVGDAPVKNERIEEIKDNNSNVKHKRLQLLVKPADSIQTDFGEGESLQRIVRVSPDGKFMATGGTDGHVRLWKFPQFIKVHDVEAHVKEIDDIDFSPKGDLLVTIAKDGKAIIWDVASGKKRKELTWTPPIEGAKYMYKRCRFRNCEDNSSKLQLFILSNATNGKNPSFLQLWDVDQGTILKSVAYKETLSALAVSDNGRFVAVGTMFSGSVDIFIAFSLQRALHVPGAHCMFVTGIEFLPTKLDGPAITSNSEAAVVSISVDNRICVHSIPYRHTLPFWLVIILIILSICSAFIVCSYLGI